MGKKRPAPPPAASSAFANGTAFRKSASKKRKGDGEVETAAKSSPRPAKPAPLMKGKEKESAAAVGAPRKADAQKSHNAVATTSKPKTSQGPQALKSSLKAATQNNGKAAKKIAPPRVSVDDPRKAASSTPAKSQKDSIVKSANEPVDTFRVIVGSYERLLYGFQVTFSDDDKDDDAATLAPKFTTIFSFAAHTSCITAVAAASMDSKWLATGAGDETVRVWDLKKKKEVGGLIGHGGTIHSLSFPTRTYLLSTDSSGLINLYRTRDWALLKTLRGHTGKVNACVAHPSGKLALSVGKDGMLRMWDLMRGKGAGAVRLNLGQEEGSSKVTFKEEPLDVQWNHSGSRLAVMGRTEVVVFKTDMTRIAGLLVKKDDSKRRFGCVTWQGNDVLLTGNEMGVVELYRVNDSSVEGPFASLTGHTNRVRAIRTTKLQLKGNDIVIVITISSDGHIRLFDITSFVAATTTATKPAEAIELKAIGSHDTGGARLTCLDVVGGTGGAAGDSLDLEKDEDDGEEDSDEEEGQPELGQAEIDELNDLLDLVEEAKRRGVHLEGMSEFESSDDEDGGDDDDDEDDDEDVYSDGDMSGLQEDEEEEEEEEEEEAEDEEE